MKEQKKLVRLWVPLGFSCLLLALFLCSLSPATGAEPRVSSAGMARVRTNPTSLDYQTNMSVCQQIDNLVLNPEFGQDLEESYSQPDHWYEGEPVASQSMTVSPPRRTSNSLEDFNPSFETDDGWNKGEEGECFCDYANETCHGHRSAQIVGSERGHLCRWWSPTRELDELSLTAGRRYYFSGWIRTDCFESSTEAYISLVFFESGDYHEKFNSTIVNTNTVGSGEEREWVEVSEIVEVPPWADHARVECRLNGKGQVWFDYLFLGLDVVLELSETAYPNHVAGGDFLTYTLIYSNTGREKATGVEIIDIYDDYVSFRWADPEPFLGTKDVWKMPQLLDGASDAITIVVQVNNDTEERAWLFNNVVMLSAETFVTATLPISIDGNGCDILLYLPIAEQPGKPGEPTDYALELENAGRCDGEVRLAAASSNDWDVRFAPLAPYTVLSGRSKSVTVSPVVPPGAPGGTVDVTLITATLTCGPPCTETTTATATATITTTVIPISLTNVNIAGPTRGSVSTTYAFTADVSPVTANQPITYIWWATRQREVSVSVYAPSHTVFFTWDTTGTQTIVVTAVNALSTATDTHVVTITIPSYLPLVLRRWPPVPYTPVLKTINNPDGDGNYTVSWDPADLANTYTLEEDDNAAFSSPTTRYTGAGTSWNVTNKATGRYYYRVKASNSWGDSGWSNVKHVDVLWEHEPNNSCPQEANGPIISGLFYYGTFTSTTDVKDYFYFDLGAQHSVEVWLTNIPNGCDYDLALRDASCSLVRHSDNKGTAKEHVLTDVLPSGQYYVQVYRYSKSGSTEPYHLRVVYE